MNQSVISPGLQGSSLKDMIRENPVAERIAIEGYRLHCLRELTVRRELHMPNPGSDPDREKPDREVPNPSVPPDMEPVVPQQDPPQPGRPGDGEPPPIIA